MASGTAQERYDNWKSWYEDDEDWEIGELTETTDSEGNVIYVAVRTNTSWEEDYYIFIRVVDDNSVVYAEVSDYDDPVVMEDWIDILSSQYIQINAASTDDATDDATTDDSADDSADDATEETTEE